MPTYVIYRFSVVQVPMHQHNLAAASDLQTDLVWPRLPKFLQTVASSNFVVYFTAYAIFTLAEIHTAWQFYNIDKRCQDQFIPLVVMRATLN